MGYLRWIPSPTCILLLPAPLSPLQGPQRQEQPRGDTSPSVSPQLLHLTGLRYS